MKRFRPLLAALLAWMLCFQAVAGVTDIRCQHAGPSSSSSRHVMDGHEMTMASMPHEAHAMHTGHRRGMEMPGSDDSALHNSGAASICGCSAGCYCAGQCAASASGVVGGPTTPIAFTRWVPAVHAEQLAASTAHGLDLYRPPSIS